MSPASVFSINLPASLVEREQAKLASVIFSLPCDGACADDGRLNWFTDISLEVLAVCFYPDFVSRSILSATSTSAIAVAVGAPRTLLWRLDLCHAR